jgi:hypothetical protein
VNPRDTLVSVVVDDRQACFCATGIDGYVQPVGESALDYVSRH